MYANASQGANVAKKIVLVLLALAGGWAVYFGVNVYRQAHNTPEAAMASFMADLSAADVDQTYQSFSNRYASSYKRSDWQSYVRSITGASSPKFTSSSEVIDQFNVYPSESNPQRFIYSMQVNDRQYWVSAVILKQDGSWKIDDFQGSYK